METSLILHTDSSYWIKIQWKAEGEPQQNATSDLLWPDGAPRQAGSLMEHGRQWAPQQSAPESCSSNQVQPKWLGDDHRSSIGIPVMWSQTGLFLLLRFLHGKIQCSQPTAPICNPASLPDASLAYCQRTLVGGSGMIRTQMRDAQ
jgi:hypothetical protein